MDHTEMQAVIDTAKTATGPVTLYEGPEFAKVYIPGHGTIPGKIESVDLSATLPKPARKRGVITVFDAASFNQVIADNSDAGDIAIYIDRDVTNPAVVAILNGNGKNGPGWSDMRVKIAFRKTPQWVKWQAIDGKMLPQVDFAEFVENNLEDIADPPKADFLEIVTYLQATRSVDFKSGIRLSSGAVQFQNLESLDAKVGAGQIAVMAAAIVAARAANAPLPPTPKSPRKSPSRCQAPSRSLPSKPHRSSRNLMWTRRPARRVRYVPSAPCPLPPGAKRWRTQRIAGWSDLAPTCPPSWPGPPLRPQRQARRLG